MGKKLVALGLAGAIVAAPPVIRETGIFDEESSAGQIIETAAAYETLAARAGYAAIRVGAGKAGVELPAWAAEPEVENADMPVISDMVVVQAS